MQPIDFPGRNIIFAENQKEYLPLPAHLTKDGIVTCCWKLSFLERIRLLFSGRLFLTTVTFNTPLQPLLPSIHNPIPDINKENNSFIPIQPEQNN
jgi:hypothetical protein